MSGPVCLLAPDAEHKRLIPQPEGLELLRSLSGPVAVLSVVGNQRSGKSTLLNLLWARSTVGAFGLGHSYQAATLGVWIAAKKNPRSDVTLVLMDTEGLDTPGVPQAYNWMVASVALLLSSLFCFQTRTSLDNNQLETFQIILQAAAHLKKESLSAACDLLWLIRDSQLTTVNLKQELLAKFEDADRGRLERCFGTVDCFALPRPVSNDGDLSKVEGMPFDSLTSAFREEYVVLERKILDMLAKPRMLGKPVDGPMLASLTVLYASAIASDGGILGDISQLPTQKQLVQRLQGERAVRLASQAYHSVIATVVLPQPIDALYSGHVRAWDAAVLAFYQEANVAKNGPLNDELRPFFDELVQKTCATTEQMRVDGSLVKFVSGGLFHSHIAANQVSSQHFCRDTCAAIVPVATSVSDFRLQFQTRAKGYYGYEEALHDGEEAVRVALLQKMSHELKEVTREGIVGLRAELGVMIQAQREESTKAAEELRESLVQGLAEAEERLDNATSALRASVSSSLSALQQAIDSSHSETLALFAVKEEESHHHTTKALDVLRADLSQELARLGASIQAVEQQGQVVRTYVDGNVQQLRLEFTAANESVKAFGEKARGESESRFAHLESLLVSLQRAIDNQNVSSKSMENMLETLRNEFVHSNAESTLKFQGLVAPVQLQARELAADVAALKAHATHAKLANLEREMATHFAETKSLMDDSIQQLHRQLQAESESFASRSKLSNDSITQSVEAMWAFLGGVNSRITNCEAVLDERGTVTTPNRATPTRK